MSFLSSFDFTFEKIRCNPSQWSTVDFGMWRRDRCNNDSPASGLRDLKYRGDRRAVSLCGIARCSHSPASPMDSGIVNIGVTTAPLLFAGSPAIRFIRYREFIAYRGDPTGYELIIAFLDQISTFVNEFQYNWKFLAGFSKINLNFVGQ